MRALLQKDWIVLKKYFKMYLLMVALFVCAGAVNAKDEFFVTFPLVLSTAITMSLISYDERFHWDSYCAAMPVSRKLFVTEKYVIDLIMAGIIFIPCVIGLASRHSLTSGEFCTVLLIMLGAALLMPALMLPVIFKLGVEKGRLTYYIMIGLGIGICYLSSEALSYSVTMSIGIVGVLIAAVVFAALFWYSWKLSVRFFADREL